MHTDTAAATETRVTVGVDTHAEQHVAAALDQLGRLLGTRAIRRALLAPTFPRPSRCSRSRSKT
jgi:hypothetical protein